jgi:hypothetical protein
MKSAGNFPADRLINDRSQADALVDRNHIVGDVRCGAVSLDGSIDWLCLPRSVPGGQRVLTPKRAGGSDRPGRDWRAAPLLLWPETNILVTRFLHPDGIAEVEDYMPVGPGAGPDAQLVRRVRVVRGRLPLEMECRPAFDYARARHVTEVSECGARFDGPGLSRGLAA